MSRTDAHTPYRLRVARHEVSVVPVHRCAGRECDLSALVPDWSTGRIGRCYLQFTYTGTNVCSCWMCHWHTRPQEHRSAVRAGLRDVVRDWNGGGTEAGWRL